MTDSGVPARGRIVPLRVLKMAIEPIDHRVDHVRLIAEAENRMPFPIVLPQLDLFP